MAVKEEISAWGHPNITATHRTTFEITRDEHLTKRGDCIIGVRADKSISEISDEIKEKLRENVLARIELVLPQYGLKEVVEGYGSSTMTFDHPADIVVRKSNFVCGRTLLIKASKAARDLNREMIELLKDSTTELLFIIRI
jgi:hypothetical protein